jgi:hypothetical protein
VLVTLGAVAGSLLSAAVFWGLERVDLRQAFGRAEPQAVTVAMSPAAGPVADQTLALLTSEPTPLQPDAPCGYGRDAPPRRDAAGGDREGGSAREEAGSDEGEGDGQAEAADGRQHGAPGAIADAERMAEVRAGRADLLIR